MESTMSGAGSWMGGMMPMGGWMMLVSLVWLGPLLAAIAAIVWLIAHGRGSQTRPDARQVFDVRYARGELTQRAGMSPGLAGPALSGAAQRQRDRQHEGKGPTGSGDHRKEAQRNQSTDGKTSANEA